MTNKKTNTAEETKQEVKTSGRAFYFPSLGKTVEAETLAEALNKIENN